MWIIEPGRLISLHKVELTYIRKDQLISIDTQEVCESVEIFCPETIKITKLPWQKCWTIDTKNWVLEIIKLNGVAQTIAEPLILKDIANIKELYAQIQKCSSTAKDTDRDIDSDKNVSFSTLDPDCSL